MYFFHQSTHRIGKSLSELHTAKFKIPLWKIHSPRIGTGLLISHSTMAFAFQCDNFFKAFKNQWGGGKREKTNCIPWNWKT